MMWLVLCLAPSSHAAFAFSPVYWLDRCPVSSLNMPSSFQPEDLRAALFSACDTQCPACGVAVPFPPLGQRRQCPWEAISDHIISVGPSLLLVSSVFVPSLISCNTVTGWMLSVHFCDYSSLTRQEGPQQVGSCAPALVIAPRAVVDRFERN